MSGIRENTNKKRSAEAKALQNILQCKAWSESPTIETMPDLSDASQEEIQYHMVNAQYQAFKALSYRHYANFGYFAAVSMMLAKKINLTTHEFDPLVWLARGKQSQLDSSLGEPTQKEWPKCPPSM